MNHCSQLFRFLQVTLIGSAFMGTLVGCQPNTSNMIDDTKSVSDKTVSHKDDPVMHDEHEHHETVQAHEQHSEDHSGHDHGSKSTPFNCEPTATIGVFYHSDSTPQTAHLLIDGIEYDLNALTDRHANTSNQTYISDIGLDENHGLIWQINDNDAILMNKTLNSTIAIEKEKVLFNCHKSES